MGKLIAELKRYWEDMDSNIWVDEEEMDKVCMILYYNGVELARMTEDGTSYKITFFATRRKLKKIQKDIHDFCVPYRYAIWGV